jgi:hypothetical protein
MEFSTEAGQSGVLIVVEKFLPRKSCNLYQQESTGMKTFSSRICYNLEGIQHFHSPYEYGSLLVLKGTCLGLEKRAQG